jgi:hypothetical protein
MNISFKVNQRTKNSFHAGDNIYSKLFVLIEWAHYICSRKDPQEKMDRYRKNHRSFDKRQKLSLNTIM